ncbi:hypothetical protein B9Z55_012834 [Caenorhabditis nigoni]|nr:hypothetical protein B9Z55_012834 [Caenorhabditis nigoni]
MAFSKVLKYTDENGFEDQKLKSLEKNLREAHNREIDAYKLLEKFNHTDVPFTKVYGLKPFASESDLKGFIIMEYIPDIFTTSMAETLFADDLIPTIKGVSTFAALGHKLSDDEKSVAVCGGYLEGYFNTFLGPASIESTFQNLSQALSFLEPSKAEKLVEVYRHYLKILNKFTKISEILGFHQIFNHGDLWQSNMLYKTGSEGKLELKAIIDWQGLSLLPPAFDMTRLFIGCLSPEDRRQRAPELLKIFHETFVHVLGEELFSYQEVYDSYNLHFPLMSLMVLPGMVQFLDAPHLEEPEKSALKMRTMKNMEAIMEDVFVAHEYNLKNYANFIKE